ncbi:unknown [Clostridium sp. CAG:575]|nr:unknown [Clostridium sp. CAG:575]
MDMYQKRKMRQEKVNNENEEETQNQMNINWEITTYGKLLK